MKLLVIGGARFSGRALSELALARGHAAASDLAPARDAPGGRVRERADHLAAGCLGPDLRGAGGDAVARYPARAAD